MAEITLQQIAELMDQKLATQEARMDQKLAAQTAQVAEMVDEKLAAQEARMDQKFADLKASHSADIKEVIRTIHDLDKSVEDEMAKIKKVLRNDLPKDLKREISFLVEQKEGRKIESLYEESQAHKATLGDHEARITELEEAAG